MTRTSQEDANTKKARSDPSLTQEPSPNITDEVKEKVENMRKGEEEEEKKTDGGETDDEDDERQEADDIEQKREAASDCFCMASGEDAR